MPTQKVKLYLKKTEMFGRLWLLENERGDVLSFVDRDKAFITAEFFGAEIEDVKHEHAG